MVGRTGVWGGARVWSVGRAVKSDPRVEARGDVKRSACLVGFNFNQLEKRASARWVVEDEGVQIDQQYLGELHACVFLFLLSLCQKI
jgi:cob(I)alamin adenosyltransferase